MLSKSRPCSLLFGLVPLGIAAMAVAGAPSEMHRTEVGVQGGFFLPDEELSTKESDLQDIEPTAGVRFGVNFARRLDFFVDALRASYNANPPRGDVETVAARGGVGFYFRPHGKKVQWFVNAGAGVLDVDLEAGDDFDRTFASVGVGQRVRLDSRARFRWVLRGDRAFDDDDELEGEDLTRLMFLISVNWGLGRSLKDVDSDGDGVFDREDDCPGTPPGAVVDERGCPRDTDGDGVWDGIDRCPDTPRGATVDESGCPRDTDGDGVWDGIDRCPGTPPRTPVRPDGCPRAAPLFSEQRKTLILEGVFFEFDAAVLKPESRTTLDRVARSLLDWPEIRVEVAGHTDSSGPEEYNRDLSRRRAEAVRDYLVGKGVAAERMVVRGYGESRPIADNRDPVGRAKNRRTELVKLD